jgi:hypothetical protein
MARFRLAVGSRKTIQKRSGNDHVHDIRVKKMGHSRANIPRDER